MIAGAGAIPVVPWSVLSPRIDWRQGEHVSVIGRTGGGKSTLALELAQRRRYVLVLATKPTGRDTTLARLKRPPYRFRQVDTWPPPLPANHMPRILLWPKYTRPTDTARQGEVISAAIEGAFTEGGWCIVADETPWLVRRLHLDNHLRDVWQQGRSIDLSLVGVTQRPAHVPLEMYSQASHVFIFRLTGAEDLRRLGELPSGVPAQRIRDVVKRLGRHQFLYLNTATDAMAISQLPPPGGLAVAG